MTFVPVLFVAALSWGFWFAEVRWLKGWEGLAWTSGFSWSSIPVCLLIAGTGSYIVDSLSAARRRGLFIGSVTGTLLGTFIFLRSCAQEFFSRGASRTAASWLLVAMFVAIVGVPCVIACCAKWFLSPLKRGTGLVLALGLLAVAPLSFASIRVLPALNGSTDELHAVKMGYPVFWTAFNILTALWWGSPRLRTNRTS